MEAIMSRSVPIQDPSQVGEARRVAAAIAARIGFNQTEVGGVSIAVTELATNLLKHGGGGEMILNSGQGLEILALDKGSGIRDLPESMRDGFSTAGTPGGGLGAVRRLSSALDIYNAPKLGAAIRAGFGPASSHNPAPLSAGGLSIAVQGEQVCGDAWATHSAPYGMTILVADGLGHGPGAAEASGKAVEVFTRNPGLSPKDHIEAIHLGLRDTRGAAVAVARLDITRGQVVFAGLGNICGVIVSEDGCHHSMVSHNGTAGMHQVIRTLQEFTYPFPPGALAIFHSDGLATHWKLSSYPGLARRHPTLVSAVLYRDFTRVRDDVTVVTARRAA
jgi:anti-sigma regulatory factor (Ser/Thr protein kinase)